MKKKTTFTIAIAYFIVIASMFSIAIVPEEASAYIPHDPIFIVGNGNFTSSNGVTGGLGTASDPYILEGWEINASSMTGIRILNTDAHFIIRDVFVHSPTSTFGSGVLMSNVTNGRVENATIVGTYTGVITYDSTIITISGSTISGNLHGISLRSYDSTMTIENNTVSDNDYGILLTASDNTSIINNTVSRNGVGLIMHWCTNLTFTGNSFSGDGIHLSGVYVQHFNSHIMTLDNEMNGKPLHYYKDCSDTDITGIPVGQLIVANCTKFRASSLRISNSGGAQIAFGNDTILEDSIVSSNERFGISISHSENVLITSNSVSSSYADGIYFRYTDNATVRGNVMSSNNGSGLFALSSTNLTIEDNFAFGNRYAGIHLHSSRYSTIVRNNVSSNDCTWDFDQTFAGISFWGSTNSSVYHNSIVNNVRQAYDIDVQGNSWDNGYPSGGNFWSDYVGVDNCSGPNQDICPNPDGIGDTSHEIHARFGDEYPLMFPYAIGSPRPPTMVKAFLTGTDQENVTITWSLSVDDGTGLKSVVGYDIFRNVTHNPGGLGYGMIASLSNRTFEFIDTYVGEGDASDYFYQVCAVDSSNNTTCSMTQAAKFTRPLSKGPNLVSIPLIQSDETIQTVLQTLSYDNAWSYDSISQEWKSLSKSKPYGQSLEYLDHTKGIWVNVTQDSNLTVAGVVPTSTTIDLQAGWNLVGFPSFDDNYTIADLKAEVAVERIEGFDGLASPYFLRAMADGDFLQAGFGYWIKLKSETDWTVNNM